MADKISMRDVFRCGGVEFERLHDAVGKCSCCGRAGQPLCVRRRVVPWPDENVGRGEDTCRGCTEKFIESASKDSGAKGNKAFDITAFVDWLHLPEKA